MRRRDMICRPNFSNLNLSEQTHRCLGQERFKIQCSMFNVPSPNPELGTRNTEQRSIPPKYFASVALAMAGAIVLFSVGCGKSGPPKPPPPEVVVVQV